MSQAIINVIFGCPVNEQLLRHVEKNKCKAEDIGCHTLYSANGDDTAYCGVLLDTFREGESRMANQFVNNCNPNQDHYSKATKKMNQALDMVGEFLSECPYEGEDYVKLMLEPLKAEPVVHLMWSNS